MLTFIETPIFTKQIKSLIDDNSYAELQKEISSEPEKGDLIRASGGVRKIRWYQDGVGKSSCCAAGDATRWAPACPPTTWRSETGRAPWSAAAPCAHR